jgi:uncharacterized membrane protein
MLYLLSFVAVLGAAVVAGIFFAFSSFIMTGLGRIEAPRGIAAMQLVNVVVLNPAFFAAFFGTAAIALILAIAVLADWSTPNAFYLLAGSLLYLVGTILVTIIFNVPHLSAWTAWTHLRTLAALAASACFIFALKSAT